MDLACHRAQAIDVFGLEFLDEGVLLQHGKQGGGGHGGLSF
jgi:hypothetical protein